MKNNEELKNKKMYFNMYALGIIITLFYIAFTIFACYSLLDETTLMICVLSATFVFIIACFILLRMEVEIGYYECMECHHKFVPTFKEVFLAPHMCSKRYLKCPKCGNKSWAKKTMSK